MNNCIVSWHCARAQRDRLSTTQRSRTIPKKMLGKKSVPGKEQKTLTFHSNTVTCSFLRSEFPEEWPLFVKYSLFFQYVYIYSQRDFFGLVFFVLVILLILFDCISIWYDTLYVINTLGTLEGTSESEGGKTLRGAARSKNLRASLKEKIKAARVRST